MADPLWNDARNPRQTPVGRRLLPSVAVGDHGRSGGRVVDDPAAGALGEAAHQDGAGSAAAANDDGLGLK